MQVTAQMLREAFHQTQREILETPERYESRWERMAELLNEKLGREAMDAQDTLDAFPSPTEETSH